MHVTRFGDIQGIIRRLNFLTYFKEGEQSRHIKCNGRLLGTINMETTIILYEGRSFLNMASDDFAQSRSSYR